MAAKKISPVKSRKKALISGVPLKISLLLKMSSRTQASMAKRVGVPPSHLNFFLKGKSDIRTQLFLSILEEMGINLEMILDRKIMRISGIQGVGQVDSDDEGEILDLFQSLPAIERQALISLAKRMASETQKKTKLETFKGRIR